MELVNQLNNCIGLNEPLSVGSGRSGSTYKAILICMCHTPVISREVVSYYFPELSGILRVQFNNLEKKGFIKACPIKHASKTVYDGRTKVVYSLTKKGYDEVVSLLTNPPFFYNIKSDRYLMHYYASAHIFFALLKRGSNINGYHLEKQLGRFSKAGVQEFDLYCDAVCYTRTESLFFEQDMGTEKIPQIIDKFERYNFHSESLLEGNRSPYIIMLFKEPYKDFRSSLCFNTKTINELAEIVDSGIPLSEYYKNLEDKERTEIQSKHYATISDFYSKFPRYKDISAAGLREYATGIEDFTGKDYYKAFNNYQYQFSFKKRQALLKEYYRNYMTYYDDLVETEPLYSSFKFFKENMQCYLWATTGFKRFLEFFYEDELRIEALVQRYFPNATKFREGYWTINKANMERIANKVDRDDHGLFISTCNTYVSNAYHICVEFPTINIGSFVRILHLRQRLIDYKCGINIYLGVLSKNEAIWLTELLKLYETPYFGEKVYTAWHTNFFFFNIGDFKRLYTIIDDKPFYFDKVEVN